jgi:uncharacterized protein
VKDDDESEFDEVKSAKNLAKHGVSLEEGDTIFGDPLVATIEDPLTSLDEDHYLAVGMSSAGRIVVVAYTFRDDKRRLFHARLATPSERRKYMKGELEIRDSDDILPEYDFSNAVRGLHYRPRTACRVTLEPDVYAAFKTSQDVNEALRELIREGRVPVPRM